MEPNLAVGEVIVTKSVAMDKVKVGDIVSFRSQSPDMFGVIITHRVVEIDTDENNEKRFLTKGDANLSVDGRYVLESNFVGKVIWTSGKVIVPIVLSNESISIGEDDNGDLRFAITALDQNVPKRISAIVYLDGANLTNEDVLAAADIQGQMNIQFGSSVALVPLNNETLYSSEFYAEVDKITPNEFDFDALPSGSIMNSDVSVRISGTQPNQVKATFIRRINATQGTPEEEFTLTDADGDGIWEGSYGFKYPGTYILRSILVDGVERDLKIPEGEDFPKVLVKGFSITRVSYDMSEFIMTDVDHYSGNVSLQFMSDNPDKMPKTVVGKFVRDDGAEVNVNFNFNATTTAWQGVANFTSSGEYTMQYDVCCLSA